MMSIRYHFNIEEQDVFFKNPFILDPRLPLHLYVGENNVTKKITGSELLSKRTVTIINKYLKKFPYNEKNLARLVKNKSPANIKRDKIRAEEYKKKKQLKAPSGEKREHVCVPPPASYSTALPPSTAISKYFEFAQSEVSKGYVLVRKDEKKETKQLVTNYKQSTPRIPNEYSKEAYSKHFVYGETLFKSDKSVDKSMKQRANDYISIDYDGILPLNLWQKLYRKEKLIKESDNYRKTSNFRKMLIEDDLIHYANSLMSIPKGRNAKDVAKRPPVTNKQEKVIQQNRQEKGKQQQPGSHYRAPVRPGSYAQRTPVQYQRGSRYVNAPADRRNYSHGYGNNWKQDRTSFPIENNYNNRRMFDYESPRDKCWMFGHVPPRNRRR